LALRGSVFSFAIRNGSGECVSLYVMRGCNNSMTDEQILRKSYAYFGMNDDGRWPEQLIDALSFLSNERSDSNLTKIANCGHDENGNYTGGQAGDQTGEEYHIIDWYNRPWNCVLRWPNKDEANLAADMATQAANNDLVGYNQDDRISFYNHLKASDWRPEQITVPCNADCSAASNAIWIGVGNRCNVESLECLNKELCTGEMKEAYSDAGFEVLTDERYLNSSDYLLPGDVLLYEGHHTAINLTPGSNSSNEENTDNTQYEYDELHVKGQHGLNEYFDSGIDEDGERGPKTLRAIIKAHQHAINMDHGSDQGFVPLDEDGDFGPNTEEYSGRYFIKPNDTFYDVTVLECALYCHGFDANGIEYPGEYGGGLMGAIHQYQGNDDNVGKNMWKSLCST
jgi:hypothetical protein